MQSPRRLRASRLPLAVLFVVSITPAPLTGNESSLVVSSIDGEGQPARLLGPDDGRQLIVSSSTDDTPRDLTHDVAFEVADPTVISIRGGYIQPQRNGITNVSIHASNGQHVSLAVHVSMFQNDRVISFPNDIVPQLTRAGCNSGTCHGTPSGKNNFRLSLLGFEPKSDYEYLRHEARGRRILPLAPSRSLLVRKATGEVPHGGGARIEPGSPGHRLLNQWIQKGMPYAPQDDPRVVRIEVFPEHRIMQPGSRQQLLVSAHFDDGSIRDITRVAQYKANQKEMCSVDNRGLVSLEKQTGTTSVMIRFQEQMAAFRATIPLGLAVEVPPANNFIDQHVFEKLKTLGLPPSDATDDATFLRRSSLDLTGRLPTIQQTRDFLSDNDPQRRRKWIDACLESPGYAEWFANKWAGILRNKAGGNLDQVARETFGFHSWIYASLSQNVPFDQFTTELLTASGTPGTNAAVSWYRAVNDPKDQMADIAQVFLGVRIQCAQCHHHPYEKWTQNDYYGLAAFFSTLQRKEVRKRPEDDALYHNRKLAVFQNPDSGENLKPTPLDAKPIDIPPNRDPRVDLASWITSSENPFFAKVLVNRYWKHFFGRGLIEPEDDIRITNPATHPELLDALAESFTASGFDLKQLCRDICNSVTYQLSSLPNDANAKDTQNFARYYPRRMSAEVMLDAMNDVALAKNNFNHQPVGIRAVALPDDSANNESFFLRVFGRPQMDTACECERTSHADLAQSLHLINSDTMQRILTTANGRAAQLAKADCSDEECIEEIYMTAFARKPTELELRSAREHLNRKRKQATAEGKSNPEQAEREAFEDILWVVVNTKEFLFNH